MEQLKGIKFLERDPKQHDIETFDSWDDIFEYQKRADGANYTLLKQWLKQNFNKPTLK